LSNNQLDGSIPSQLGHLTALHILCVVRPHAARPSRPLARQPTASPAAAARLLRGQHCVYLVRAMRAAHLRGRILAVRKRRGYI
jgi:hypothetical protein